MYLSLSPCAYINFGVGHLLQTLFSLLMNPPVYSRKDLAWFQGHIEYDLIVQLKVELRKKSPHQMTYAGVCFPSSGRYNWHILLCKCKGCAVGVTAGNPPVVVSALKSGILGNRVRYLQEMNDVGEGSRQALLELCLILTKFSKRFI